MPPAESVLVPVLDAAGLKKGTIQVSLLPRRAESGKVHPLLDESAVEERLKDMPAAQLLEGEEYRFTISLPTTASVITTDRPEIFEPDTEGGTAGRLRPRLYTGTLPVSIFADGAMVGTSSFEVRSKKLDYGKHFNWMLRDLANEAAELVMERFAPSERLFSSAETNDARTLYQRFAFLRSLIQDESLATAIRQVLARPHVAWEEEVEERNIARGIRMSSDAARMLTKGGRRSKVPAGLGLPLQSLPNSISSRRTETTVDTTPNRFVRYALTRWRDVLSRIEEALDHALSGGPAQRAVREVGEVLGHLEEFLGEELFRELGDLTVFPSGNQVLQKREGYRDIYRTFIQIEMAAQIGWPGGDDLFRAGQRDVATLYEYWTFLQLGKVVSELSGSSFDFSALLEVDEYGLSVSLRRGRCTLANGYATRLGRRMRIDLAFNRTFSKGDGSWTRQMRPDCSIEIVPMESGSRTFDPIWLHFDAKYRVDGLLDIFGQEDSIEPLGAAKRTDLLKMHSYRDAIHRSAGAYVLYPGSEPHSFQEYHELLPGLGAFALTPTDSGDVKGSNELIRFLDDVLNHLATQVSQHERSRYWNRRIFETRRPSYRGPVATFLHRPPADTQILLGYVRSLQHAEWIRASRLYNIRASGQSGRVGLHGSELSAEIVVLYGSQDLGIEILGVSGPPELHVKSEMVALGYPNPRSEAYYCFPVRPVELGQWSGVISLEHVVDARSLAAPTVEFGRPVVITWHDLVAAAGKAKKWLGGE